MAWHLTDSVETFHHTAGDFLRSRPVEHTIPLTIVDTLQKRGPHAYGPGAPIFGWWQSESGAVDGAFLQTPPHPLLVTVAPAMPELAALLAGRPLPGVNGLVADADVFAEAWQESSPVTLAAGLQSRLFRLDVLTPPAPLPPGAPRVAGPADRDLLTIWMTAFHDELGEGVQAVAEVIDDKLSYGGLTLWEVDGVPVSMAGATRREAGMVRVIAVYTPRELRGRGYAGAVTTTVSQAALDAGADDVVLYTDLANPTSNALYQRLGYRPVEDRAVVLFQS
jgi:RimJ/RimL family protein N-acetyltransferase